MFPLLTRAVKALLLINVGVFLVNTLLGGLLIDWLGLSLAGMIDGFGLGSCRLLTYQFVHSYVDIWHLLLNMLTLYFLGTMVEPEVGYRGMVKLYLASGVVGGLVQILFAGMLDCPASTISPHRAPKTSCRRAMSARLCWAKPR